MATSNDLAFSKAGSGNNPPLGGLQTASVESARRASILVHLSRGCLASFLSNLLETHLDSSCEHTSQEFGDGLHHQRLCLRTRPRDLGPDFAPALRG